MTPLLQLIITVLVVLVTIGSFGTRLLPQYSPNIEANVMGRLLFERSTLGEAIPALKFVVATTTVFLRTFYSIL